MMSRLRLGFAVSALCFSTLSFAPLAHADVAPPNACNSEGASCQTAGSGYDAPGTCKKETCTRATPDGSMEYECLLCAGGASGSEPTGGTSSTGGSAQSSSDDDDGGCSVTTSAPSPWSSTALVAAGFGMVLIARRRLARS